MKLILSKGGIVSKIKLIQHKLSSPYFKLGNNYGVLTEEKPSYPTIVFSYSSKKYYLLSGYLERTIQFSYIGPNSSSGGTWNAYKEYVPNPTFMLAEKIKCNISFRTTAGNFDYITIRVYYINVSTGAQVTRDLGWGSGSNWAGTFSGSYELTDAEISKLGGPGAIIKFGCQSNNNRGSAGVSIEATVTISTLNKEE